MTYKELIEKLGNIVDENGMLLRIREDIIYIETEYFYRATVNKIQRILHRYSEVEFWIKNSETLDKGVMYQIYILSYK